MKIVARFIWDKTERGYGYRVYEGCRFSIEKHGQTGYYGIYEKDGTLVATCADYRSAQRIVARFRKAELAWFQEQSYHDFILLEATDSGAVVHTFEPVPGYHKETFPSLEAAKSSIQRGEHIFENGKCVGYEVH